MHTNLPIASFRTCYSATQSWEGLGTRLIRDLPKVATIGRYHFSPMIDLIARADIINYRAPSIIVHIYIPGMGGGAYIYVRLWFCHA